MKRKMKRYAGGGETDIPGYEEDPQPGTQSDKKSAAKKRSGATSPRRVSSMEFIRKYETSPASSRIQEEASVSARKPKQNLPGDRSTGFATQRGIARGAMDLDQEDVDRALESMKTVGELAGAGTLAGGLRAASKANLPLRFKQMMRRRATEQANEAARAADKAGENARRGMSRRGVPRYDERYRAGEEGYRRRAEMEDAALSGLMYRKGGRVKSSASSRADGIAKKGKTRGRFV